MLIRSITATTALALIAVAAAETDPDRPRIYFPRQIKREISNSSPALDEQPTDAVSDLLRVNSTGPETSREAPPLLRVDAPVPDKSKVIVSTPSSQSPTPSPTPTYGSGDELRQDEPPKTTTDQIGHDSNHGSEDELRQDDSKEPTTEKFGQDDSTDRSSEDELRQDKPKIPTTEKTVHDNSKSHGPGKDTGKPEGQVSDTAIVIAPTGIVGIGPSSATASAKPLASLPKPNAAVKGSDKPLPAIDTSGNSRAGFAGTNAKTATSSPSSIVTAPIPLKPAVSEVLAVPGAKTSVTESPANHTSSEVPAGLGNSDPVLQPPPEVKQDKPQEVQDRFGQSDLVPHLPSEADPKKTTDQSPKAKTGDGSKRPESNEPVPAPVAPPVALVDSVPALLNTTESTTEPTVPSPTELTQPTIPPPIAVLPTGSMPKDALLTKTNPTPTSTVESPIDRLLPIDPDTTSTPSLTQSLPDLPLRKTTANVPASNTPPAVVPAVPSGTNATTGKLPEVPIANTTASETTTAAPIGTDSSSVLPDVPVANKTADLPTRPTDPLPTGPSTTKDLTSTTAPSDASKPPATLKKPSTPSKPEPSNTNASPSNTPGMATPSASPHKPKFISSGSSPNVRVGKSVTIGIPFKRSAFDDDVTSERAKLTLRLATQRLPSLLARGNPTLENRIVFKIFKACWKGDELASAIALVYVPDDFNVDELQAELNNYKSAIYQTNDAELRDIIDHLARPLTKEDPLLSLRNTQCPPGTGISPDAAPGQPQGMPKPSDSGSSSPPGLGDNAPGDAPSSKGSLKTAGAVVGAVGASVLYGTAMFIIARRYKRKKQSHRRSNSITNNQNSSEMRYTGMGSPAFAGGALLSHEHISYGADGRDSRGSGRSGMGSSSRTANISAPVAAENSLGWN